ncbi:MAG: hypothetical protein BA872_00090 [Desulfobacterales bacterium C00003060]|nr:MAG: hypothetical protein BA872_00090 [Desulfobacterales bacterium C00003060]
MKRIIAFAAVLLVIVAISGCTDNGANDAGNVTGGERSNDTNTTLSNVGDRLNDSEELINESAVRAMLSLEPEPGAEATPVEQEDSDITVEMNKTVDCSGLSVTCTMVKNEHCYKEGTDWTPEVNVRHIKLYVTINMTDDYEIETGLDDWWIADERGRRYQTTPHTDIKPMKPVHKLSDGDTVNAYLLFDLSGNVADFAVQYNISNVIPNDCEVISWVVGDPSLPIASEYRDGFVRYPIRATGGCYYKSNSTWINDNLTFCSDDSVTFSGTHRSGLGMWELVESDGACNVYNVTLGDQVYTVEINIEGGWWSNGCGAGMWDEM